MDDPVTDIDGHNFERKAIEEYINLNSKSPITGKSLTLMQIIPN